MPMQWQKISWAGVVQELADMEIEACYGRNMQASMEPAKLKNAHSLYLYCGYTNPSQTIDGQC